MAQQLKFMIDQAKVQSDALRDTAVTQAKIQAENDKREVIDSYLPIHLLFAFHFQIE